MMVPSLATNINGDGIFFVSSSEEGKSKKQRSKITGTCHLRTKIYFGLRINPSNLCKAKFGVFDDNDKNDEDVLSYLEVPKSSLTTQRMNELLKDEELSIEIISFAAGSESIDDKDKDKDELATCYRLISAGETRLWESGMICQHYDFRNLVFQTKEEEYDTTMLF